MAIISFPTSSACMYIDVAHALPGQPLLHQVARRLDEKLPHLQQSFTSGDLADAVRDTIDEVFCGHARPTGEQLSYFVRAILDSASSPRNLDIDAFGREVCNMLLRPMADAS